MRTSYKSTGEILEHIKRFQRQVEDFYKTHREEANKPRVQMLLDYMARQRKHLEQGLVQFEQTASKKALETWYQYVPKIEDARELVQLDLDPELSVDKALQTALTFSDHLIAVYADLAERSPNSAVQELFSRLLETEKREKRGLVKDTTMLKDL